MTNSAMLATRSAARVAARAATQVPAVSSSASIESRCSTPAKTRQATVTWATVEAMLNAALIGWLRRSTRCTTATPTTAASTICSAGRKNSPMTSGAWLRVMLWLSRPKGRCTAKRSVRANSAATIGHQTSAASGSRVTPGRQSSSPVAASSALTTQIRASGGTERRDTL